MSKIGTHCPLKKDYLPNVVEEGGEEDLKQNFPFWVKLSFKGSHRQIKVQLELATFQSIYGQVVVLKSIYQLTSVQPACWGFLVPRAVFIVF